VYQHIDVLELQKENEFSVGRMLRIGGKYNYSDLDELIQDHVKAMAKKVDEMIQHEKYQHQTKTETGKIGASFQFLVHTNDIFREMANYIHRSQPKAISIRFLLGYKTPRLLPPVLQGWTGCSCQRVAR
jgi:hypothetical protein